MDIVKPLKSCPDIMACLADDHGSVQSALDHLSASGMEIGRKRAIFKRILPLYQAHTHGKEASVLEEGIQVEALRSIVREALESHEVVDYLLEKVALSVDDEQWEARLSLLCDVLHLQLKREKDVMFPLMAKAFSEEERELLGRRYLEARNQSRIAPHLVVALKYPEKVEQSRANMHNNAVLMAESGKVGYVVAWVLGVPAWILLLVFLIHG